MRFVERKGCPKCARVVAFKTNGEPYKHICQGEPLNLKCDGCGKAFVPRDGKMPEHDCAPACESKVRTHEAFIDSEHAIALAMNEEFDAKAAPACTCPRMEPPAKFGHHVVCPLRAADNDSEESDNVSIKEGPLTLRQIRILNHLRAGKRHEEIAPMLAPVPGHSSLPQAVTVSVVKQECQNIRVKFGTSTVMQAVSLWATAQAYREAATLIDADRPLHPESDEVDGHVWHVLTGLSKILRDRADRLTPR